MAAISTATVFSHCGICSFSGRNCLVKPPRSLGLQQQPLDPDLPQVGFNDTPQLFGASGSGSAVSRESFKVTCVTSRPAETNSLLPASGLLESAGGNPSFTDLDRWMLRQQRADPEAPGAIVV